MLKNASYIRNQKIAWQVVDDKIVLVSPQNHKIHILSGSGSRIWEHLKEMKNEEELVGLICDEFDVSQQKAEEDLDHFLTDLVKEELVLEKDHSC